MISVLSSVAAGSSSPDPPETTASAITNAVITISTGMA